MVSQNELCDRPSQSTSKVSNLEMNSVYSELEERWVGDWVPIEPITKFVLTGFFNRWEPGHGDQDFF